MSAATVYRIGDLCDQIRGVTYSKDEAVATFAPGYKAVLRANNITGHGLSFSDLVYVPQVRVSARQYIKANDVVIAASSGSIDVVGKAARAVVDFDGGFGAFCKVLRPNSKVDPSYFAHFFKTPNYRRRVSALAAGANINNLRNEHLDDLEMVLPSLTEQRRIAAILDKADALRAKRREAIAKLDQLLQSVFLEVFGDPVSNPKGWPMVGIAELADQLRDGPFGSNLKSAHYQPTGVRVIRLQNIGVWKFLGEDAAYISEAHYKSLPRNHCRSGDVLIGTLGDPNLRACILPKAVGRALNKADCLLFRPNEKVATAEYVCGLINCESLIRSASGLALGQTRLRVSVGRLKELTVPLPPLSEQRRFSAFVSRYELEYGRVLAGMTKKDQLFASIQTSAFA